tara:strand:+ start:58 stop:3792 length:3735 start_codon:yes stop_codon:yes gene_type:complete
MIELPDKLKQAIGDGQRTSLYPVLRIYKGVTIDTPNQDFAGAAGEDNIVNLSIKETSLDGQPYLPLLLSSPSLKTSADIINNKYTISSLSLTISNAPYNGKKFSDNVIEYLKSVCQVFYTSNGIDSIDDSLLIYTGTIRRFSQTFDSLKLELEDFTQQVLSAKVPSTLIPEDFVQYDEKMFNKPYPMIYGNIDASPLVYNKLGRLEIDKPAQKVYGFWNFGTTIDYQNETIDENHPFRVQEFLRDNSFLSVYEGNHLYIFQNGVKGWGSRDYKLEDLQFYDFIDAETDVNGNDIPARIEINSDSFVYEEYQETAEGEVSGTGNIGIPARTYRPIIKASFFSYNEKNRNIGWNVQASDDDGGWIQGQETIADTVNKFIGYQNNSDLADDVVQEVYREAKGPVSWDDDADGFSVQRDKYETSVMQEHYRTDWGNTNGPEMYWWEPTYVNNITSDDDRISRWSSIDTNWRDAGMQSEFDVSWVQNGLTTSGIHMYAVNYYKAGGNFVRFHLEPSVGSFPCITKIFYEMDYITPKFGVGNVDYLEYNVYPTSFWVEKQLVQRDQRGDNSIDGSQPGGGLLNDDHVLWERNRGSTQSVPPDDWITWANVPNSQHSFGDVITIDQEAKRVETDHQSQFTNSSFYYHNILKDFNNTTQYDSVQWGFSYITHQGGSYTAADTSWAIANLKNLYVIQDVLIDDLENQDFFGNIAGRVDNVGNQITRIEDIMVDVLDNELGFEQIISLDTAFNGWKFDFTLTEQKEVKQLFGDLFKSSIAIPSYDNFGQFKLIPIHQTLENVNYRKVRAIDVIKYEFTLSKLDDVKNRVNVKYYKDYASGELTKETGYSLLYNENTYETFDSLTENNYPNNPELWYDVNYYGLNNNNLESMLEVESEYIRDDNVARMLQKRLLCWYANQHLMVKMDLPVSYLNLEAGDYFKFDELLGGVKVFGYDYTEAGMKNGQYIYPIFFITTINKSIEKISIEAIQVHRGEYGVDEVIIEEDEEGGTVLDNGGNDGQGNFDMPDPFDDPSYEDDNINQEEPDYSYFNLSMSENIFVNNGQVTGTVNTSHSSEWDYKIFATKIESNDGSPIYYEDENGDEQPLETGTFIEEDDFRLEHFFHIYKQTSNMADNYNGQVQINKKYSIFPHNCNIEASLKVYSLSGSQDNEEELIKYGTFSQKGEWEEGQYPVGDVNGDYIVNVLDVVRLVNIVLGFAEFESDEQEASERARGDLNNSGFVNVQDVIMLIQIILG